MTDKLIFQTHPRVEIATNTFINVPIILQYEKQPLIEITDSVEGGFTTKIPIFHPDGTYLAVANGSRLHLTNEGKKPI